MSRQKAALEKVEELQDRGVPQRIPALTVYELYIGVGQGNLPKHEREKIEKVLYPRMHHEVDNSLAAQAGIIEGELRANGKQIGAADALIGATALRFEEPVLTNNPDHFSRIDGVEVETY